MADNRPGIKFRAEDRDWWKAIRIASIEREVPVIQLLVEGGNCRTALDEDDFALLAAALEKKSPRSSVLLFLRWLRAASPAQRESIMGQLEADLDQATERRSPRMERKAG